MKLPQLVNPITGGTSSLSIRTIVGMILAAMIGFFAVATAQNLNKKVSSRLGLDTEIDPLVAERPKAADSFKRDL